MASPACDGHIAYLFRIADGNMVLAQRLAAWIGAAHSLEEEMALGNIALDLLGQATLLYEHIADLQGDGRNADDLAFLREDREYLNPLLCELDNGDFAVTILRLALYSAWMNELWPALAFSTDEQLAGVATKAVKESSYHWRHASEWMRRLALGTDESRARVEAALELLWPYTAELFEDDAIEQECAAANVGVLNASLAGAWRSTVDALFDELDLSASDDTWMQTGGKRGLHTEALGFLLAEMQHLQRTHPGAVW
jgi:ring-1,2-phenylacetyl-CoA epoxidase subunit PaaC